MLLLFRCGTHGVALHFLYFLYEHFFGRHDRRLHGLLFLEAGRDSADGVDSLRLELSELDIFERSLRLHGLVLHGSWLEDGCLGWQLAELVVNILGYVLLHRMLSPQLHDSMSKCTLSSELAPSS